MFDRDEGGIIAAQGAELLTAASDGQWVMPEGMRLFTADFSRSGSDLLVETLDGQQFVLGGYFASQELPDILAHDGAVLRGSVVDRLAGPLFPAQYAQLGGASLTEAIGQVETLEGAAFVERTDGQVEQLEIGMKVFQGDLVRTDAGGALGLTFADGTIFTLAAESRMVLDELIYDPEATDNSGVFNLVEGGFVFIAGQAAKTGGIEINTPAATMGIRGTTGKIDIQTVNGVATVTVSLNPDPDGGLGVIDLYDLTGTLIASITGTDTQWIISPPFTGEPPIEIERDAAGQESDSDLLLQALAAFQSAVARVNSGETFVELPEGDFAPSDDAAEPEEDDAGEQDPVTVPPINEEGDGGGDGQGGGQGGSPDLDGQDDPVNIQTGGTGNEDVDPTGPQDPTDDGFSEDGDDGLDTENDPDPETPTEEEPTVNEPSTIQVSLNEDTSVTGAVSVAGSSGASLNSGAQNGLVVLSGDGSFIYTPNPDFEGTDSFSVSSLDENGQEQISQVTVVVEGVNDAPRADAEFASGVSIEEGATTDASGGIASGRLTYVDVDLERVPGTWTIVPSSGNATAFGSISIDPTSGNWQYSLDQAAADALTEGDTFDEVFIATVTDAAGESDVTTLTITITGSNDSPVITSAQGQTRGALEEGSISGGLSYTDVDEGETPGTWSIEADGGNATAFGSIYINPTTGLWIYSLTNGAADNLPIGESITEVFIATVTDALGATASQAVTITVTGSNAEPIISFSPEDIAATVVEDGFDPNNGTSSRRVPSNPTRSFAEPAEADATGTLNYVDPDGEPGEAIWTVAPNEANFGTMTIDAVTGEWKYFLNQTLADSLKDGDVVLETFIATITDPLGGSASQEITITVEGSNDAAVFTTAAGNQSGTIVEGDDNVAEVLSATGTLSYSDPDAAEGEVATWSIVSIGQSRGIMTIDEDTGVWTYTIDAQTANALPGGDNILESFRATVTDAFGATNDQLVTITLDGTNDAPTLGAITGAGNNDQTEIRIDLTQFGVDPDDGDQLTYDIHLGSGNETSSSTSETSSSSTSSSSSSSPSSSSSSDTGLSPVSVTAGGAGTDTPVSAIPFASAFTIDGDDLVLTLNQEFNNLGYGQTEDATVDIIVTDSFGLTSINTATVTVTGTVSAPVIDTSNNALVGDVTESGTPRGGFQFIIKALVYTDEDEANSGDAEWSVSPTTSALGTMAIVESEGTVTWQYQLNEGLADYLLEGQKITESFDVTVTDLDGLSDTEQITITITGSNDEPSMATGVLPVATEDGAPVSMDVSSLVADVDANDSHTFQLGNYDGEGIFSLSGSTLTFDPGSEFQYLEAGGTTTVGTTVTVTDGGNKSATGDISVTVTGLNDAPIAAADSATVNASVGETPSSVSIDVLSNDFDIDRNSTITVKSVSDAGNGSTTILQDGNVQYTPDSGFSGYDTFTYDIEDELGVASSSATVTVLVQEDQPPAPQGFSADVSFAVDGTVDSPAGSLGIETLGVTPNQVEIAFVLDSSGSIGSSNWTTIETAVSGAVSDLGELFVGSQTELETTVIQYANTVTFDETYTIFSPGETATDTSTLESDFANKLGFTGGGTNWDAAFTATETYFDEDTTDAVQVLYFVTDGNPNNSAANGTWDDTAKTLREDDNVDINVFAIGSNVSETNINLIEGNAANAPVNTLSQASDLVDSFAASPLFNPELVSFTMDQITDGVVIEDIATAADLTKVSGLTFDLALADIASLQTTLGDSNQFIATAVYDVGAQQNVEVVEVGEISKFGGAVDRTGTDGNDLMLGSDLADTIDGGTGKDLIMAFAGDDEISISGTEAAALDGGDGRDVLSLLFEGSIDLQDLNAKNVEAIDLTNGTSQTLNLTLDHLLTLSGDGDVDLNNLLDANGITTHDPTQTTTILGETGDAVSIALSEGQTTSTIGDQAGYDDGSGNTLQIYQIYGSSGVGEVLATLGVEAEVSFTSPNH